MLQTTIQLSRPLRTSLIPIIHSLTQCSDASGKYECYINKHIVLYNTFCRCMEHAINVAVSHFMKIEFPNRARKNLKYTTNNAENDSDDSDADTDDEEPVTDMRNALRKALGLIKQ